MKRTNLHDGWMFWKDGHESEKTAVRLPHDAMQSETRIPDIENGPGCAYYPGGKYWYSKTIFGKEEYRTQSVIVEFEGVYMNSTVRLNGEKVGGWGYGYTNFFCNLTEKIRIGENNELLVEADNSLQPNARWYTGSGIYRPVRLWIGGKTYVPPQGLKIRTLSIDPVVVELRAAVESACSDVAVSWTILDGDAPIASAEGLNVKITLPEAKRWSAEHPHLYTAKATVYAADGSLLDTAEEKFGVRVLDWSVENGLRINGEAVKLKGGCIHHDNGILGARSLDEAERRRIRKLKGFGFNALRYSHYPIGKNLLEICDELGMYILEDTFDMWRRAKNTYDYSIRFDQDWKKDLTAMAEKDYNHPSVLLYCIGNEIPDTGRSYAPEIARQMTSLLKRLDGTRPVTIANNAPMSIMAESMERLERERGAEIGSLQINELLTAHPDLAEQWKQGAFGAEKLESIVGPVFDEMDITGQNYAHEFYAEMHRLRPDRILLSAETFPRCMASNWKWVSENAWVIGDFHWTAWDYLGEAGVGLPVYGTKEAPFSKPYPCRTAACGSFDLTGMPEACAWYVATLWGVNKKPWIGVRPVTHSGEDYTIGAWRLTDAVDCWTWEGCEGRKAEIVVYGTGSEIALYKDGQLLDRKPLEDCKAEFETVYQPGQLEAVSFDENNREVGRHILRTNGSRVLLCVEPERAEMHADPEEIIFVPIRLRDERGDLRPMTDKKITVSVSGNGELIALGSGRPESEELFSADTFTSWHGMVLAAVRATGKAGTITVRANAAGLAPAVAEIRVRT